MADKDDDAGTVKPKKGIEAPPFKKMPQLKQDKPIDPRQQF